MLLSMSANASNIQGTVISVWAHNMSNHFLWEMDKPLGSCSTFATNRDRYVVDISTNKGRMIASTILAAYASKQRVNVGGTGTCAEWTDSESVNWVGMY